MTDDLYPFFEEELEQIRNAARGFARKYPRAAGNLQLEATQARDPHVDRLIESFAYIAARIHRRLDDQYPELTDALLGMLYPEILAPLPACCVAEIDADPEQLRQKEGLRIAAGTQLLTRSVDGVPCKFQTVYPVHLWPLRLDRAAMSTVTEAEVNLVPQSVRVEHPTIPAALTLSLRTAGGEPLRDYALSSLRVHLTQDSHLAFALYDALLRQPIGVLVRCGKVGRFLPPSTIKAVGFSRDEGMFGHERTGLLGYRLLTEFFVFPEKFLFVDFTALDEALREIAGPTSQAFEIVVLLPQRVAKLERLTREHVRLSCTPVVNRFVHEATPVRLDSRRLEYPVQADDRHQRNYEILSVTGVLATSPGQPESRPFRPFFALHHGERSREVPFYHVRREPADDGATDMSLLLVDPAMRPIRLSQFEVLHVTTQCCNRDLPSRLAWLDDAGDFFIQGQPQVRTVRALQPPTPTLRPHLQSRSRWQLVSHLGVNYMSLAGDSKQALESFREVLSLYDFAESRESRERRAGLVGVATERVTRVLPGVGPVRGVKITLTLASDRFVDGSAFLFASVLEAFLGMYVTINSFVVVEARLEGGKEALKSWPPRIGEKQLI